MSSKTRKVSVSALELERGLSDALDSIRGNVDLFIAGTRAGWLAVEAQLYILLCDPNPSQSLLGSLMPDICFYPLTTHIKRPKGEADVVWLVHSPAPVHFESGTTTIELFSTSEPKVPMKKWLKQVIGVHHYGEEGYYATIENLIYYARNQLGPGHLDRERTPIAKALEYPQIRSGGAVYPFYEWATVVIGDMVESEVRLARDT